MFSVQHVQKQGQKLFINYMYLCLDDLVAMCKEFHGRVFKLEGDKWDLERGIKIRLLEVFFISVLTKVEVELSRKIKPPNGKILSFIFRTLLLF